jgi:hypothetical protein
MKLRNVVVAVGPRVEFRHAGDCAEVEFAVKVRKQIAAAGWLPAQCVAKGIGIHRDQKQPALAEEVSFGRLGDLRCRREMNEAVARIIGAAEIDAPPFGFAPGRSRTNFVDRTHRAGFPSDWSFAEQLSEKYGKNTDSRDICVPATVSAARVNDKAGHFYLNYQLRNLFNQGNNS